MRPSGMCTSLAPPGRGSAWSAACTVPVYRGRGPATPLHSPQQPSAPPWWLSWCCVSIFKQAGTSMSTAQDGDNEHHRSKTPALRAQQRRRPEPRLPQPAGRSGRAAGGDGRRAAGDRRSHALDVRDALRRVRQYARGESCAGGRSSSIAVPYVHHSNRFLRWLLLPSGLRVAITA